MHVPYYKFDNRGYEMESITLKQIIKKENTISYVFSVSQGLRQYFSDKQFLIEYPENVETVPDSIAAVPFACNVLPIIWLTNSELRLKELDKAFYDCIPDVIKGHEKMFPESVFAGAVLPEKIVACDRQATNKSAVFFSGGLDAVSTLISHFDEKPALISIWGADIRYDNAEGWKTTHKGIAEYAYKYNLEDVEIRSAFREFDREYELEKRFGKQLQDDWWHGVKHGLGLLGHAAPYAYLKQLSTVYIASSFCADNGIVRCSSSPYTDNYVRFAGCKVVHDGFEFSRQDKMHNVVQYVKKTGDQISLRVCWETPSGNNCCHCEKCYRTMAGILAEGDDCAPYGFADAVNTLPQMRQYITVNCRESWALPEYWDHIGKRVIANRKVLREKPYWKNIRWMAKVDFHRPETLKAPRTGCIRSKLATMRFYQLLHQLKEKFHG